MDASIVMYVVQALISVLGVLLWSNYNDVKDQSKQTQKELAEYKTQVAKEYVSREEIDRIIASMSRTIEQHTLIISDRFNRLENLIEKVRDRE
jgi:septal ring factor EnvC (AmiA/AmiB activator)